MTRDELVDTIVDVGLQLEHPPFKLLELAERVADRFRLDCWAAGVPADVMAYDLRHEQDYAYPHGARKALLRGGRVVQRDPAEVTHLVLHQAAVEFGVSARQVRLSGGNRELALARRALDVACHGMAFRDGFYVLAHPIVDYIQHGNGFNSFSIGMEIDGCYAGIEDDPSTVAREDLLSTWRGEPTEYTEATSRAARACAARLVTEARKLGAPMTTVVAHRQSSPTRRSDPGESIWKDVAAFCVEELGMKYDPSAVLSSRKGPGKTIPVQWDPVNGIGSY